MRDCSSPEAPIRRVSSSEYLYLEKDNDSAFGSAALASSMIDRSDPSDYQDFLETIPLDERFALKHFEMPHSNQTQP